MFETDVDGLLLTNEYKDHSTIRVGCQELGCLDINVNSDNIDVRTNDLTKKSLSLITN